VTVYAVEPIVTLPLVSESVQPAVSLPVTVKVKVPEAVPLSLGVPTRKYLPRVLVIVIACPTEMFTWLCEKTDGPCIAGPPCWKFPRLNCWGPTVQPVDPILEGNPGDKVIVLGVPVCAEAGDASVAYASTTITKAAAANTSIAFFVRVVILLR
jgi:hypothetical protein